MYLDIANLEIQSISRDEATFTSTSCYLVYKDYK